LAPFLEALVELGLEGFFSAPSRPHHADVAEPSFPPLRGLCGAYSLRLLWRRPFALSSSALGKTSKRKRREFRPYKVPDRRNLERVKFYSKLGDFTSEIASLFADYRTYFQWFAGGFVAD
jgi:hypothetical protein